MKSEVGVVANYELFPPGASTAFVIVKGAVDSLLGFGQAHDNVKQKKVKRGNLQRGTDSSFDCYKMIDKSSGILTLPLRQTPRHLDLKRLQEETAELQKIVQKVIDRTIYEGVDLQWIKWMDNTEDSSSSACRVDTYLVENYVLGEATKFQALYSRSNCLGSITLNHVAVDPVSQLINLHFTLVEDNQQKRLTEPIVMQHGDPDVQSIVNKIRCLTEPTIRAYDGYILYDRLQKHWWRLPMVHFVMTVAALYVMLLILFIPGDMWQLQMNSKPALNDMLNWNSLVFYILLIRLNIYFSKTGVFERLWVQSIHLRNHLDKDMTKIKMLIAVCFVPFLQPTGQRLVVELVNDNAIDSIVAGFVYFAKSIVAFFILISYPALSYMSSMFLASIIADHVRYMLYTAVRWSGQTQGFSPGDRANALMRLANRVMILLLALTVFVWYFHLSHDVGNPSAVWSTYWTEAALLPLLLELGLFSLAVVMGSCAGLIVSIVIIVFRETRRLHDQIRLRLPVRRM